MRVSAIIPAFNEGESIARTVNAVKLFVDEVLVIDDGSCDATAAYAESAGARVLRREQNEGYISSVKLGFAEAKGDILVTADADGEFPADRIPQLVAPILGGQADMVQGRRNTVPRVSERLLTWLANRKGSVGDSGSGFRALRADLAKKLHIKGVCICGVLSLEVICLGGRIVEIPIKLQQTMKPRRVAWHHLKQLFYLLPFLLKQLKQQK